MRHHNAPRAWVRLLTERGSRVPTPRLRRPELSGNSYIALSVRSRAWTKLAVMTESATPHATARLARERRIHALRMRVVAIAVALFLAAWAGLFVQLVSGHDPALASSTSSVAAQSADPAATDDGWSDGGWSDGGSSDAASGAVPSGSDAGSTSAYAQRGGADGGSSRSSAPAAVTTGQS